MAIVLYSYDLGLVGYDAEVVGSGTCFTAGRLSDFFLIWTILLNSTIFLFYIEIFKGILSILRVSRILSQ